MPKFAKGSKEAKDYMASLRAKRGAVKGKGAFTDIFLDTATKMGTKAGEPFKNTTGVNPFTLGYNLGKDVIAPQLFKVIPPKKGKGMRRPDPPPPNNPILAQPHYWNGQEWVPVPQQAPMVALEDDEIIEGEGARRRRRIKGGDMLPPAESGIAPSNRDLTPELTGGRLDCEYCPCDHCGGMGLKKKTRN